MKSNVSEPVISEEVLSTDLMSTGRKTVNRYFIYLAILILLAIGVYLVYPYIHIDVITQTLNKDHHLFYWMLLTGFLAEIVAGSMGMGYGVICTTILLILNIPPPIISASIHSAESFTSAAGTISHFKLGNVNKKLMKHLAIPAVIGAVIGAIMLTYVGERYAKMTKPFIAAYTMYLGIKILSNAFSKKNTRQSNGNGNGKRNGNGNGTGNGLKKKTNITRLGFIGGFIDSFGGGGWGPLVTGTFIKNGRTPRYVIGSSTAAKFILTFASAVTFIFTVGIHHWNIVAGLLIGGIVTAPFSAMLTAKLPVRKMFVVVGVVVIIMSLITIFRAIFL